MRGVRVGRDSAAFGCRLVGFVYDEFDYQYQNDYHRDNEKRERDIVYVVSEQKAYERQYRASDRVARDDAYKTFDEAELDYRRDGAARPYACERQGNAYAVPPMRLKSRLLKNRGFSSVCASSSASFLDFLLNLSKRNFPSLEKSFVRDSALMIGISINSSMGVMRDVPKNAHPNAFNPMLIPKGMANRASAMGIIDNRNTASGAPSDELIASAMLCTNSFMLSYYNP